MGDALDGNCTMQVDEERDHPKSCSRKKNENEGRGREEDISGHTGKVLSELDMR